VPVVVRRQPETCCLSLALRMSRSDSLLPAVGARPGGLASQAGSLAGLHRRPRPRRGDAPGSRCPATPARGVHDLHRSDARGRLHRPDIRHPASLRSDLVRKLSSRKPGMCRSRRCFWPEPRNMSQHSTYTTRSGVISGTHRASLLPGLLAATRTGLQATGDDELAKPQIHHGSTSQLPQVPLSARKPEATQVASGVPGRPARTCTASIPFWREREPTAGECNATQSRNRQEPFPGQWHALPAILPRTLREWSR
jgi:hypothetical protein